MERNLYRKLSKEVVGEFSGEGNQIDDHEVMSPFRKGLVERGRDVQLI